MGRASKQGNTKSTLQLVEIGFIDFIAEPFDPTQLAELEQRLLPPVNLP